MAQELQMNVNDLIGVLTRQRDEALSKAAQWEAAHATAQRTIAELRSAIDRAPAAKAKKK